MTAEENKERLAEMLDGFNHKPFRDSQGVRVCWQCSLEGKSVVWPCEKSAVQEVGL